MCLLFSTSPHHPHSYAIMLLRSPSSLTSPFLHSSLLIFSFSQFLPSLIPRPRPAFHRLQFTCGESLGTRLTPTYNSSFSLPPPPPPLPHLSLPLFCLQGSWSFLKSHTLTRPPHAELAQSSTASTMRPYLSWLPTIRSKRTRHTRRLDALWYDIMLQRATPSFVHIDQSKDCICCSHWWSVMLSFVKLSKSSSLIPRLSPNVTQAMQAAESWAGPGKRLPVQYITVCSRISLYIHSRHILAYPQYISVYLSISQYIPVYHRKP